eukprot:gene33266-44535_t
MVHVLRARNGRMAMGMGWPVSAIGGDACGLEDIHEAFSARSRMLVTSDFVEALLGDGMTSREEVEALIRLAENVTGAANKRQAARYLAANVSALRFEKEQRYGPDSPATRMAALAVLQKAILRAGLVTEDAAPIQARVGEIGGMIEADGKIVALIARASAPVVHRLNLMVRMAVGEAAPLGPAADRARAEALKLVRNPEFREALSKSPEAVERVRGMMQTAGMAA